LFLFTFTFGSSLEKIKSLENKDIATATNELVGRLEQFHGAPIDFNVAPFVSGSCPDNVGEFAHDRTGESQISVSAEQYAQIDPMILNLCRLYEAAFSAPVDVLGLKPELDLRR